MMIKVCLPKYVDCGDTGIDINLPPPYDTPILEIQYIQTSDNMTYNSQAESIFSLIYFLLTYHIASVNVGAKKARYASYPSFG